MMTLNDIKSVYFLGIGGIGMSAIARFFNHQKVNVSGYDKTPSPLTLQLEQEGIAIHYVDDASRIPANIDLCVYTPAVPTDLNELQVLKDRNVPILKRSQVLGVITDAGNTIAIAGTHGKTSTTSLTAHLLKCANAPVNAFIGGIAANYNTNLLLSDHADLFVVEADEFDRSFLTLHPKMAVITSVDADHLDIYGDKNQLQKSFVDFSKQVKDLLLVKEEIKAHFSHPHCMTYSIRTKTADYHIDSVHLENEMYTFDLVTPNGTIAGLQLGIGGLHNVENAVAASALVLNQGISEEALRKGLSTFKGVRRRFETIIKSKELVFIDDYAHHPTEIEACLTSLREMYPNRRITAVFQPHLFSRTRDFAEAFAESLALADELLLLDIYPAREEPIDGITSEWLLSKVNLSNKKLVTAAELNDSLLALHPNLVVTMGAGDIDRLIDGVKETFIHHYNLMQYE